MQPESNSNSNTNSLELRAGDREGAPAELAGDRAELAREISEQPGSLALAAAARRRRSVALPSPASPRERSRSDSAPTPTTTTTTTTTATPTTTRGGESELNLDDGPPYLLGPVPLEHRYPLTRGDASREAQMRERLRRMAKVTPWQRPSLARVALGGVCSQREEPAHWPPGHCLRAVRHLVASLSNPPLYAFQAPARGEEDGGAVPERLWRGGLMTPGGQMQRQRLHWCLCAAQQCSAVGFRKYVLSPVTARS